MNASRGLRAVIFDLGGVVFPSPIDAMRAFEAEVGLPHRSLSEVILAEPDDGAWNRMERGQLTVEGFVPVFEAQCAAHGHTVDAAAMMARIAGGLGPRPEMVTAIDIIRDRGLATAALTNNWVAEPANGGRGPTGDGSTGGDETRAEADVDWDAGELRHVDRLGGAFDVVVESAKVGLRKPDPRIYEMVCTQLDVEPPEAAFLDDLGANLKPARAMGMTTIKVANAEEALDELAEVLGFALTR